MNIFRASRWALLVGALAALTAGTPASAATAVACQVEFQATFTPGLAGAGNTIQGGNSQLRIAGTQTCPASTPSTANVSVGTHVFTTPATDPTDIANGITTYKWQDPVGSVIGGCINNRSDALAVTRWSDGGISIFQYTTNSFTYGITVTGTGTTSALATAVDKAPGQPAVYSINATRDVGASLGGLLLAGANSPTAGQAAFTACNSATGLTTVTLTGTENIVGA